MATYTVKTFNQSIIGMKVDENGELENGAYCIRRIPYVSLPFTVMELGLSGNILLKKEDFNFQNAEAQVKEKIEAELVRLAEHKEYQVTV